MRSLSFTILLILLTNCGALFEVPEHDDRFNPILKQFEKDAEFFGVKGSTKRVTVLFGDPSDDYFSYFGLIKLTRDGSMDDRDGVCTVLGKSHDEVQSAPLKQMAGLFLYGHHYGDKFIFIHDKFKKADIAELETLVYHELGHCVLGRDHNEYGIMQKKPSSPETLNMNRDRYRLLHFLFLGKKTHSQTLDYQAVANYRTSETDVDKFLPEGSELIYEVDYRAFDMQTSNSTFQDQGGNLMILNRMWSW